MSAHPANINLIPATEADFEQLADLRVAAMRESLERVGRFDPERARARLRNSFSPAHTRMIVLEEEVVGFYAARSSPEGLQLDHLYVHPRFQGRGIGGMVLRKVIDDADQRGVPVLVGALKESVSNRFYQHHGFSKMSESEWDNHYIRPPSKEKESG